MLQTIASNLYTEIKRICAPKEIEVGFDEGNPSAQSLNCTITNGQVSLILEMNVLDAALSISELAYRALIPSEPIHRSGSRRARSAIPVMWCAGPAKNLAGERMARSHSPSCLCLEWPKSA